MVIIDYKHIKKIIDQWDPMELLHMAPNDEYSVEIKRIKAYIDRMETNNVEALAREIQKIFKFCFSTTFKIEECLEIGKEIMEENK
ncbi:MAG: YugE family protein [Maledivibacter sp.]|jgi:hypothetical protein|nr:YugE family protein [Maledivibacter sp.]